MAFSSPTVARTSCLQYSISSTSTRPLGLWSSFPETLNSLHADCREYNLLRNAQSSVRRSKNLADGQSFTRLLSFPGSDIGARVERIMAVSTMRGKYLFG